LIKAKKAIIWKAYNVRYVEMGVQSKTVARTTSMIMLSIVPAMAIGESAPEPAG